MKTKKILLCLCLLILFSSCNRSNDFSNLDTNSEDDIVARTSNSSCINIVYEDGAIIKYDDSENGTTFYDELVFYEEYQIEIHPDMLPTSVHEKQLFLKLGKFAEETRLSMLQEIKEKASSEYYNIFLNAPCSILSYIYVDIDDDGVEELFAEVSCSGKFTVMYVSDSTSVLLDYHVSGTYVVESPRIVTIEDNKFVLFTGYASSTTTSGFLFGVDDGVPYSANISGKMIDGVNEYNELLLVQSTYDASTDGTGRTWKPYYFYLSDKGIFSEYGGIEVSFQDVYNINGAKEILDDIMTDEFEVQSVYYRANGVININCVVRSEYDHNEYITLRYVDGQVVLEDKGLGHYSATLPTFNDNYIVNYPNNTL